VNRRRDLSHPQAEPQAAGSLFADVRGGRRVRVCRWRWPGTCRTDLQHRRAGRRRRL